MLLCLLVVSACSTTPTQTVVFLLADPPTLAEAKSMKVTVWNHDGDVALNQVASVDEQVDTSSGLGVFGAIPLVPMNEDAARTFTIQSVLLDATEQPFWWNEGVGRYVKGRQRGAWLPFTSACREVRCSAGFACSPEGACERSCLELGDLEGVAIVPSAACPRLEPRGDAAALVARYACDTDGDDALLSSVGPQTDAQCMGTCAQIDPTGGRVGGGCLFDGQNYAQVVIDELNDAPFSVSLWANQDTAERMAVVSKRLGSSGIENSWKLDVRPQCDRGLEQLRYSFGSTGEDRETDHVMCGSRASQREWIHLVVTWDGRKKSLFINGEVAAESYQPLFFDDAAITIGGDIRGDNEIDTGWVGALDEIRFYRGALRKEQVEQLLRNPDGAI